MVAEERDDERRFSVPYPRLLARRDARAREKTLRLKRENNSQRIPDGSLRDDSEDAFHPPFNSSSAERTHLRFLSTDTRLFPSSFRCSPLPSSPLLRMHPVAFCSRLPFSFSPVSTFGTRFLFILVLPLLAPFSLVLLVVVVVVVF